MNRPRMSHMAGARRHRRFTFLLAFAPLLLATILWWLLWRGYAQSFHADLARVLPPGTAIEVTGFPYRLEAAIDDFDGRAENATLGARLGARALIVNRTPFQHHQQVLTLHQPRAVVEARGHTLFPLFRGEASADSALASLHVEGGRLERLSIVWNGVRFAGGLLAAPLGAATFETHVRELRGEGQGEKLQFILRGDDVRFQHGAPLRLELNATLGATASLADFARFAPVPPLRIDDALFSDATGVVARFRGRVDVRDGQPFLRGVVETSCPGTLRAAIAGLAAAPEKRTRKPQLLTIAGVLPHGLAIPPAPPGARPPPVLGQEPDCPRLR